MEPCQQAPAIDRLNDKIDKVAEALQVLAVQKTEIGHLARGLAEHRDWLRGQERRIQALEKHPGDSASRFVWLLYGGAVSGLAGTVGGVVVFLVTKG